MSMNEETARAVIRVREAEKAHNIRTFSEGRGAKKKDPNCIQIRVLLWKRNHMLIEFLPMGANARLLVQIDTYGCKSRGAVARHPILRKDSAVDTI